jgi:nucleoside-diphosphate-sugar epimerase
MKYTINGSTGWLGQATLGAIKNLDSNNSAADCQFLASGRKIFETIDFGMVSSHSLSADINKLEPTQCFIQLAFKTRDHIAKLGIDRYEEINNKIINESVQAIKQTNPSHVVMVSSGVVSQWLSDSKNRTYDSYIKMKLTEEEEITKICRFLGINLVNLRLWGASGRHMTEPLKYAIGDLIHQNLTAEYLEIRSGHPVYRRYADASQQMELCIRQALSGENLILESGGIVLEIQELAEKIIETSGSKKRIKRIGGKSKESDRYYSTSKKMEDLADSLNLNLMGIESQILLTSQAVTRHLLQETSQLN